MDREIKADTVCLRMLSYASMISEIFSLEMLPKVDESNDPFQGLVRREFEQSWAYVLQHPHVQHW